MDFDLDPDTSLYNGGRALVTVAMAFPLMVHGGFLYWCIEAQMKLDMEFWANVPLKVDFFKAVAKPTPLACITNLQN